MKSNSNALKGIIFWGATILVAVVVYRWWII